MNQFKVGKDLLTDDSNDGMGTPCQSPILVVPIQESTIPCKRIKLTVRDSLRYCIFVG